MRIDRSKSNEFEPEFRQLTPGEVFEHCGELYMKIYWPKNRVFRVGTIVVPEEGTHTAVHLGTGKLVSFPIIENVKKIKGVFKC